MLSKLKAVAGKVAVGAAVVAVAATIFYETGALKKILIAALVLFVLFVVALFSFSAGMRSGATAQMKSDMTVIETVESEYEKLEKKVDVCAGLSRDRECEIRCATSQADMGDGMEYAGSAVKQTGECGCFYTKQR